MKWDKFIKIMGNLPVITSENLRITQGKGEAVDVQVSRWAKAGKLLQLKRGAYILASPYRKTPAYEPFIAQVLKSPSYVSLEKAMEFHGLIPEGVPVFTSVTPKRQNRFETEAGIYSYRHIHRDLFWGYEAVQVHRQTGFVAAPEKALLDFVYLNAPPLTSDYLVELRLQNGGKINESRLIECARRFRRPKMTAAAKSLIKFLRSVGEGEKEL